MAQRAKARTPLLQRIPRIRFRRSSPASDTQSPVTTYYLILVPAIVLGVFGLMMGFSASAVTNIASGVNPYLPFLKTVGIAVLALGLAFVSAMVPPNAWDRLAPMMFLGALIFQLMLIPFGLDQGGNKNWLLVPGTGMTIQPSEFLKLATCLLLARMLSQKTVHADNPKHVAMAAVIPAGIAMGAVMIGSDMGTMLIFVGITFGAMWVAGVPLKWFAALAALGGAGAIVMVAMSPSRTRRVLEFLPGFGTAPSTSAPTQTDHGLWALGSGGLTGLGPGASREKWNYLQEAHTDFILAIVGEEFGLIGTLTLLALLGLLIYGILRLSANASSRFVSIAAGSIATWLAVQGFINVGTVTGLAPVIGVPFPLVSAGGSSFLFTAMAIGVLLSFARSEAGMKGKGRFNPDTAGRDPRRLPERKKVRSRADAKRPTSGPVALPPSANPGTRPGRTAASKVVNPGGDKSSFDTLEAS